MSQTFNKCESAMFGHAIANNFQVSTLMAIELSQSLRQLKRFESTDVMSHYLYLCYSKEYSMGKATKLVYEELKSRIESKKEKLPIKKFLFSLDQILNASRSAHEKLNGLTAGCNPAQRSYPLAFCPWIEDEKLFEISFEEARLTHFSPQAGQVSGVINLICRRLIRGDGWNDAINFAFQNALNLSGNIKEIQTRYEHDPVLDINGNAAFAPNTLHTSLHCVTKSDSYENALELASNIDRDYCPTLVGLLAGARWGVPQSILDRSHNEVINTLRQMAKCFTDQWKRL